MGTPTGARASSFIFAFCLPFPAPVKLALKGRRMVMEITQEFVETLRCPACRGELRLKADASALKCADCRRVYAIKDDIPDMLVEHATLEEEELSSEQ